MTPEIRARIDQIRNGEVPEGYRKTLWGIAPTSWGKAVLVKFVPSLREAPQGVITLTALKEVFYGLQKDRRKVCVIDGK